MIFYDFAIYLARSLYAFSALFSTKARAGVLGRRGLAEAVKQRRARFASRPVWFHFASAGEFEQALAIIDALKARAPRLEVFLTYFSVSAERAIAREADRRSKSGKAIPWSGSSFAPWDNTRSVEEFVEALAPRAFIAIHREIWPGLLHVCNRHKLPCFLLAAFFPKRPAEAFGLLGRALGKFTYVGVSNEASREALLPLLPAERLSVTGDPRVDRVISRKALQNQAPWAFLMESRKCFIAASLWPRDLEILENALCQLMLEYRDWRFVLVPHEPTRSFVAELKKLSRSTGRSVRTFSQWLYSPSDQDDLVVDTVGDLAELYRVSSIAFVGGSFKGRVHNVLEPIAWANPVLTGPAIGNSAEAVELAREGKALFACVTPREFLQRARVLFRDSAARETAAEAARQYLASRSGAAARSAELVLAALDDKAVT